MNDEQVAAAFTLEEVELIKKGLSMLDTYSWGFEADVKRIREKLQPPTRNPHDEVYYGDKEPIPPLARIDKIAAERIGKLEVALTRLRDCDFVVSLPDRMDVVREIAREALKCK